MPDRLSIHEPILINMIGHCAGTVIFGILPCLLLVNWRHNGEVRSRLPAIAASLALFWNIGSLIALATGSSGGGFAQDLIIALSFSALSFLPACSCTSVSISATSLSAWPDIC